MGVIILHLPKHVWEIVLAALWIYKFKGTIRFETTKGEITMDIINKDLGPVHADLSLQGSDLVIEAKISVIEPALKLIDAVASKIKAAIPGQVDDALIDMVVVALKAEIAKLSA